eukprot:2366155-Amphidinium_carterae.1
MAAHTIQNPVRAILCFSPDFPLCRPAVDIAVSQKVGQNAQILLTGNRLIQVVHESVAVCRQ